MPELPEVENVRIGLEKFLIGDAIISVEIKEKKLISGNGTKRISSLKKEKEFRDGVINKKVISITRRAKNIIINFEDKGILIVHLKMTGQLILNKEENKHSHIIFNLKSENILIYNDIRKFGYVLYYKNMEEAIKDKHFSKIGLEPFDKNFTVKYFAENIIRKNKSIKTVLLDQEIVVGCGNIYADEICFASKVIPTRNCKTLSELEITSLYKNIIKILSKAISLGGSSISDYRLVNGDSGSYANRHKVYGRSGKDCLVCLKNKQNTILQKIIIGGRSTVFCIVCQK